VRGVGRARGFMEFRGVQGGLGAGFGCWGLPEEGSDGKGYHNQGVDGRVDDHVDQLDPAGSIARVGV
jgi:hypothetical protein